jgi:hypothetical protein
LKLRFTPPDDAPKRAPDPRLLATDVEIAAVYNDVVAYPSIDAVAQAFGYTAGALRNRIGDIRRAGRPKLIDRYGMRHRPPAQSNDLGPVRRYIWTSAQDGDDTKLHTEFWQNLLAYAEDIGAEITVGPFTYNKAVFSDHETRNGVFLAALQPYLRWDSMDVGPIVFCAEMNTLPTANDPLSGLEAYTGRKWGVFPHAKIALVTVPTLVGSMPKQIMTTGCVTLPNYIQKKAGLKAEFHHCIGATIVEIDAEDRVFCRQLNATSDGSFQDLDAMVRDGVVTRQHRVEALGWGDIHKPKLDPIVAMASWGIDLDADAVVAGDSMIDALRPRYQFFHDLLDFSARNHHRIKDHRFRFAMIHRGTDLVEEEVAITARFLRQSQRDFCESVIVFSNHDDALGRWLDTADFREDPANARFFLRCQLARYDAIARGDSEHNIFREALAWADERELEGITFVDDNQSFLTCQATGGIENAQHGHRGINGARGSAKGYLKTGVRTNRGHDHSPSIHGGVYTAGISGLLDQSYNRGLSGWMHTHIVTYPSGKRSLITLMDGRWRA